MPVLVGSRRSLLGVSAFSPLDIAGLRLWLKADGTLWQDSARTTPAVADGDVVGAWDDESGNGNHATQGTTSNKPLLKLNIVNGKPVVRYDGGNDTMDFPEIANIRTVFWVMKEDAGALAENFLLGHDTVYHFHRAVSPSKAIWSSGFAHANVLNGTTRIDGSVVDGTVTDVPTSMAIISLITTGSVKASDIMADRGDVGRSWDGDVAEIIIYNVALSGSDRERVERYLSDKYGIALS